MLTSNDRCDSGCTFQPPYLSYYAHREQFRSNGKHAYTDMGE